jgi:hypothetical protein
VSMRDADGAADVVPGGAGASVIRRFGRTQVVTVVEPARRVWRTRPRRPRDSSRFAGKEPGNEVAPRFYDPAIHGGDLRAPQTAPLWTKLESVSEFVYQGLRAEALRNRRATVLFVKRLRPRQHQISREPCGRGWR